MSAVTVAALAAIGSSMLGSGGTEAPDAGRYAGGAATTRVHFAQLDLARDRRAFTAAVQLSSACAPFRQPLLDRINVRDARLDARGTFSITSPFADDVPSAVPDIGGLTRSGTIVFTARVAPGGRASGTTRVRAQYRRPGTGELLATCDTGTIRWRAVLVSPGTGAGRGIPRPSHAYLGMTSRREPLVLETNRLRGVRVVGLLFRIGCPSSARLPLDLAATNLPVDDRGGFRAAGSFTRAYDGTTESYTWAMHGRFGHTGVRGTWRVRGVVQRDADGAITARCDTATIRWRAA